MEREGYYGNAGIVPPTPLCEGTDGVVEVVETITDECASLTDSGEGDEKNETGRPTCVPGEPLCGQEEELLNLVVPAIVVAVDPPKLVKPRPRKVILAQ